jgi:hypothetical protein
MNVNIEKTKDYYKSNLEVCSCVACENYINTVSQTYPELVDFLQSIGVDYRKPFETFWLENREDQSIYYEGIQYVVFGEWNQDFMYSLGNIRIFCSGTHRVTNINDKHFVIDIDDIHLKWGLQKEFSEAFPPIKKKNLIEKIFRRQK